MTTPLPLETENGLKEVELKGFSPYTSGNKSDSIKGVETTWKKNLRVEFGH